MDLALNNLQRLIYQKFQLTNLRKKEGNICLHQKINGKLQHIDSTHKFLKHSNMNKSIKFSVRN